MTARFISPYHFWGTLVVFGLKLVLFGWKFVQLGRQTVLLGLKLVLLGWISVVLAIRLAKVFSKNKQKALKF
jgi:tryptophan-rich sensory protein